MEISYGKTCSTLVPSILNFENYFTMMTSLQQSFTEQLPFLVRNTGGDGPVLSCLHTALSHQLQPDCGGGRRPQAVKTFNYS